MIAFVRGIVSGIEENKIELDTGALGYEINVPASLTDGISMGQELLLYTHLNVKEDEMSLFGFKTRDELHMFRLLITVGGIGPKGAVGILSVFHPSDLRFAILSGDAKTLSKAPGIGQKTAQRICMELKDKVTPEEGLEHFNDDTKDTVKDTENSARAEAAAALTALGYSGSEAYRAVNAFDTAGMDTEEILKEALKHIGI